MTYNTRTVLPGYCVTCEGFLVWCVYAVMSRASSVHTRDVSGRAWRRKLKRVCNDAPGEDPRHRQDPERQDPERQDPERQDPERQDPERQDPERQDPGRQDPERQDPGRQDPGRQDPGRQDQPARFMGPSKPHGAIIPSCRSPAIRARDKDLCWPRP